MTILEFKPKYDLVIVENETPQQMIDAWNERTDFIVSDFHSKSVYKKQEIVESLGEMNKALHEMVIKLKKGE